MNWRRSEDASTEAVDERRPSPPAVRTYRQIAQILGARHGQEVSVSSVKRCCRMAERKLARGMLAHPFFRAWLGGHEGGAG